MLGQAAAGLDPDPAVAEADGPAPPPIDTALSSPSVSDGASPSAKMKLQSNIDSVKKKVNIDSMKSNMDSMKKKVQGHRDIVKAAMKRRGEIMRQELVLQRE